MTSQLNEEKSFDFWFEEIRWQGMFRLKWLSIKDVDFDQVKHIRFSYVKRWKREFKKVTDSIITTHDGTEVPEDAAIEFLEIFEKTPTEDSIFESFREMDRKEKEEIRFGRDQVQKIVKKMHKHDMFSKTRKKCRNRTTHWKFYLNQKKTKEVKLIKTKFKGCNPKQRDKRHYIPQGMGYNTMTNPMEYMYFSGNMGTMHLNMYRSISAIPEESMTSDPLESRYHSNHTDNFLPVELPSDKSLPNRNRTHPKKGENAHKMNHPNVPIDQQHKFAKYQYKNTLQQDPEQGPDETSEIESEISLPSMTSSTTFDDSSSSMTDTSNVSQISEYKVPLMTRGKYITQNFVKKKKNYNVRSFNASFRREGEKTIYGKDSFINSGS